MFFNHITDSDLIKVGAKNIWLLILWPTNIQKISQLWHTTPFTDNWWCWNVEKCGLALCCNSLRKHCLQYQLLIHLVSKTLLYKITERCMNRSRKIIFLYEQLVTMTSMHGRAIYNVILGQYRTGKVNCWKSDFKSQHTNPQVTYATWEEKRYIRHSCLSWEIQNNQMWGFGDLEVQVRAMDGYISSHLFSFFFLQ